MEDIKKVTDLESVKVFDKIMESLGYSPDDSFLHFELEKDIPIQLNYVLEDKSAMGVYFYIIPWHNKRSYAYNIFLHEYINSNPNIEEVIKSHIDYINYEEKSRMGGIGWEVIYTKQPKEFTLTDRKKILFDIFSRGMDYLTNGLTSYDSNYNPKPGDILISRPFGPKLNNGFTEPSLELGTKQRGFIAKRYGFGPIYPNNLQYARYNNDLKLEPL